MGFCVISDTHNNVRALERAVAEIERLDPALVIHCGDLTDPRLFDLFGDRPLYFVFGNNDYDTFGIDAACRARGFRAAPFHELSIDGRRVFACHGHRGFGDRAARSGDWDVVFSGHSHVRENRVVDGTRLVNPGSLYRAREYTFVHYDPIGDEAEFVRIRK